MNICISSAGRRVELMRCFRSSLERLNLKGCVIAIDCSETAPAYHLADKSFLVPRCVDHGFLDRTLSICKSENIDLMIPTIDTELPILAGNVQRFENVGTAVVVSSVDTINTCYDKDNTHAWLLKNGFPTVKQYPLLEAKLKTPEFRFPIIAKPRHGSASKGVTTLYSEDELESMAMYNDFIIQEKALGVEYTVNVYVDRKGRCVCSVPHQRVEVRAGEVSKAITTKKPDLINMGIAIAEALPGAYGPLNIQMFLEPDGGIKVIEINARFGGGYPLSYHAGADFPSMLIQEKLGMPIPDELSFWEDQLAMYRFDDAVYSRARM